MVNPSSPPPPTRAAPIALALEEVRPLVESRAWAWPSEATLREGERLLELVGQAWPAPDVQVEPDGSLTLTWEAGTRGWLSLQVCGRGTLVHSAVIEGDEYGQEERFDSALPAWAHTLLRRLWGLLQ
ncbi:MAG: hypothetical protein AB1666_09365 [Pseudomonadota bacterium]